MTSSMNHKMFYLLQSQGQNILAEHTEFNLVQDAFRIFAKKASTRSDLGAGRKLSAPNSPGI